MSEIGEFCFLRAGHVLIFQRKRSSKMSIGSANRVSRRGFLKRAALTGAAAAAFPHVIPARVLAAEGRTGANSKINVGVIGTGNQGFNDIRSLIGDDRVQIVAVCDVNRESPGYWDGKIGGREPGKRLVEEHYAKQKDSGNYKGCAAYVDFRELLARKDIDAVLVATPDHWHAIPVVEACKAGKDIYCQKPLSLTIAEGRAMSDAVKKYKRVLQTGSQQRSDERFRKACELVRSGKIGKLTAVKVGLPGGWSDFGKTGSRKKPEPVPEGFNYNMWLGPAPEAPYAPARCHVNFRWGGHHPDIAQWGMDTERTGPVEIRNAKGVFPPDELWNTATEFTFDCVYKDGLVMNVSNKNRMGVTFEGSEGKVYVTRGQIETTPGNLVESEIPEKFQLYKSPNHFRHFIDCVRSRPSFHHHFAPGQHRHAPEARSPEVGPDHGKIYRRRRSQQNDQPALPSSVEARSLISNARYARRGAVPNPRLSSSTSKMAKRRRRVMVRRQCSERS
jgi:predicted dehydrogenase